MKKCLFPVTALLLASTTLSGCALTDLKEKYRPDPQNALLEITAAPTAVPERVYMDEFSGTVQAFDGNHLLLSANEEGYRFDVSRATIETTHGLIPGDHVSVIYEGQLTSGDASTVEALKVADQLNLHTELAEQVLPGKVIHITPTLLTLETDEGSRVLFSISGCPQLFLTGIAADRRVSVHYLGELPQGIGTADAPIDARKLKVVTLSDTEPFQAPAPTAVPAPGDEGATDYPVSGQVVSFSDHALTYLPAGASESLTLDLSGLPCYFGGGILPGSGLTVYYAAAPAEEQTLKDLVVLAVFGDEPATLRDSRIQSYLTGTVVGTTADTVTLYTSDGAYAICRTAGVPNSSTSLLENGSSLKVIFNPAACRTTNVLASLRLSDD